MLTRRQALTGALALGVSSGLAGQFSFGQLLGSSSPTVKTPVSFSVPDGACDCHVHILVPERFPYWSGRSYTPPSASPDDLMMFEKSMHMDRVVIVTPSVLGSDNRSTIYGIQQVGIDRARGVAVISPEMSAAELRGLADTGIVGVRINLETAGVFDPKASAEKLEATVRQIAGLPLHIQIYARLSVISALKDVLAAVPVPLVFDHFAGVRTGTDQPHDDFNAVLDLVRSGKAYVKISGAYRASAQAPNYSDLVPFAQSLIDANPDRILWGSDWPHTNSEPVIGRKPFDPAIPLPVDDGNVVNQLVRWAPDESLRRRILVENPSRLYGF
ncbi:MULTISPECIES: amidohydrolase [unclassified Pseudomonas]|uniref:amidohydrolase family protein n=1 Tax=unclassified Pseudomonas TaxID=196821 RepID=UPI0015A04EEA|nr:MULTISPECIES: amidohydrolase family protein [unclassified Pseudomonas]NVZ15445.1 amidohydrolase family protein [Pseudomonas sp. IPO3775]NWA79713.1 amidohydrolase family protein [Pseudomonas sp. C8002]